MVWMAKAEESRHRRYRAEVQAACGRLVSSGGRSQGGARPTFDPRGTFTGSFSLECDKSIKFSVQCFPQDINMHCFKLGGKGLSNGPQSPVTKGLSVVSVCNASAGKTAASGFSIRHIQEQTCIFSLKNKKKRSSLKKKTTDLRGTDHTPWSLSGINWRIYFLVSQSNIGTPVNTSTAILTARLHIKSTPPPKC